MRLAKLSFVAAFGLTGCIVPARELGYANTPNGIPVRCIDGVEYIVSNTVHGDESLTPHFKPDGSLFTCTPPKPVPRWP